MDNENQSETIGQKLHDARVAKGYTLDDLQKNTKIQKRYLMAIEENDFDALPGDFYVRAFVKQYADSVGLNGQELLNEFNHNLPDTEAPEYVDRVNDDNPQTRSVQRKADERSEKIRRYIPIVVVSIIVLIILIAIWVAAAKSTHNTNKTEIETSKVSVSGSDSSAKTNSSSSTKKAPAKKATTTSSKAVTFKQLSASGSDVTYQVKGAKKTPAIKLAVVKANGADTSAWISVTADGSSLWQNTLASGKSHTVTLPSGTSSVTINSGNAPATNISVSGKQMKLPSSTSQVRNVVLQFNSSNNTSSTTDNTTNGTTTDGTTGTNSDTTGTGTTTGY
ncbi:helix-turn-helix domain-containing protein [Lentilactobacillus sp. SPB1-3]|uniref:Helix-turn-helix domain-containing protein n=1 Tax=Lentilactobacillus terminaliae TaxID=3003483 RepID=A0ACD5DDA0_9LACO|nr:RodZ domain-containing protein [Lentilactobacillus sp. SPB1-3]MCZ0977381.1 DUF4115 domain-containing protein [Lentilactobacillus sp. SPB1-3]